MRTRNALATSATLLLLLGAVAACSPTTIPEATETERAQCEAWRDSLPSRSRSDSPQTQAEIGAAYDAFLAACGPRGYQLPF